MCLALAAFPNHLMAGVIPVVKGTVIDGNGESIIGASVLVKGTTTGTVTDFDGHFTLNSVDDKATLVISYVGYITQEVRAAAEITVTLKEDSQTLDELVVVGYGVQKKSNLTGAISQVKSTDLENRTATDLNQSLQGKTAGVQLLSTSSAPGAESNIRIRGFSSNSTSNPLYVVDGVRVSSITNIDPNDIESIEVLKDAASAAIYGAEAGNGVILVTTKKGKTNEGKISYGFQYAIQSLGKHAEVMNAREYLDYMTTSGIMNQAKADLWDGVTDTNWCDEMFESAPMQKHNLSFQNSNDKSSIYASLSYQDTKGIVKTNKDYFKRLSGTVNVDYKIKKWLSMTSSNVINYFDVSTLAENDQYKSVLRAALSLDPLTPNIYQANNLPEWMQTLVDGGYKLVKDNNGDYYSISTFMNGADDINPNILINTNENKVWGTSVQGNTAFNFNLMKGLTFTSRIGYRLASITSRTLQSAYYATATRNQDLPEISMSVRSSKYYQWENFANYLFNIGNHNFTLMAGTSYSSDRVAYTQSGGKGQQADLPSFAYPDYLSSGTSLVTKGDDVTTTKLSYFGRLSYSYDNRYMLQFTMRADAADLSILPRAQRWGYFPAVSAGWTVSNEKWFPKNTPVSSLKLRASWGQNGSIAGLSNFAYANGIISSGVYSFTAGEKNYTSVSYPSYTGNDNLKWETSEQTDLGIDLRLFDSRLSFSMDYFIKKTKDLIVSGAKPSLTVGNTVSPVNAGNVENKGFEFDLSWKDQIGDFSYGITANLATLKNKVTYLEPSITRLDGISYNNKVLTAFEIGYPVWYFRGYQVDHIDPATGNPLYVKADGTLSETVNTSDMTMIGSAIPDFTYGLTLNLAYKNFDLVVFGQGSQGNDVFSALVKTDRPATNRLSCYNNEAWTTPNQHARFARVDYQDASYWQSSACVFDGSYFKIKQIQLGYNLPKNLLKHTPVSKMRAYVSLDDFFLFTSYPGMDPEASSGPTTALGVDMGSYPSAKKVVFGLNLTF